jgi:hypothetical protein
MKKKSFRRKKAKLRFFAKLFIDGKIAFRDGLSGYINERDNVFHALFPEFETENHYNCKYTACRLKKLYHEF